MPAFGFSLNAGCCLSTTFSRVQIMFSLGLLLTDNTPPPPPLSLISCSKNVRLKKKSFHQNNHPRTRPTRFLDKYWFWKQLRKEGKAITKPAKSCRMDITQICHELFLTWRSPAGPKSLFRRPRPDMRCSLANDRQCTRWMGRPRTSPCRGEFATNGDGWGLERATSSRRLSPSTGKRKWK